MPSEVQGQVSPPKSGPNVRLEFEDRCYRIWVDDVEITNITKSVSVYAYRNSPPTLTIHLAGGEMKLTCGTMDARLGLGGILDRSLDF